MRRGKALAETQRSVDAKLVPGSGIIRAADMPLREILASPRAPRVERRPGR